MRFNPHEYQQKGIRWIVDHKRCCLFWEMGLGKSVTTLTALASLYDDCAIAKVLVVAPKKVAETTWSTEAEKWDHLGWMRVERVMGTARRRKEALSRDAEIYVIGRDSVVWLYEQYPDGKHPFDVIVLDELTSFKSPTARRFKAMRKMSLYASRVIGLTGTPAPNGLVDLWGQMCCVDLGQRLGQYVTRYRQTYFDEHRWNNIVVRCTPKKGAEKAIQDKIADICLTMQAKDYLTLPPLIEHNEFVQLPSDVMERYRRFEAERVMEFQQEHGGEEGTLLAQSAAALMNKLSQWSNGAVYDIDGNVHEIHGEKLEKLAEIVEGAQGHVLVFYQYRHDIPRILGALKGYKCKTYDCADDLNAWNAGSIEVLLAHPASTAYGLNMQQGGNYVVWFGTGWNLELYQQANARLHRQGQTKPVIVYRLMCEGTVDARACAALDSKQGVQQGLMDGLKALINQYRKTWVEEKDG